MPKTYLFWDPLEDNIVQERDESGALLAEYTTEPGLYGNVISQNRGGVERQYHYDAIGSTLALTDDSQQVTDIRAYSAFGETTEVTGNATFPFQYGGQKGYYRDEALGDYIVRRRLYKAASVRWMSTDPLRQVLGELLGLLGNRLTRIRNHYSYANNNPIKFIDPSGLLACNGEKEKGEEKCSGACFIGNKVTITKCEFTKVKIEKGSDSACNIITGAIICSQLKAQFEAANKAAEDVTKFPTGEWLVSKCSKGCECGKEYMVKKGPQKFELKDRTIESTGKVILYGTITCIVTLTGTIEVDGGGFALVPCEKPK